MIIDQQRLKLIIKTSHMQLEEGSYMQARTKDPQENKQKISYTIEETYRSKLKS